VGAPHEIVGLARRWLGRGSAVFYAPHVPSLKESLARGAHEVYLPESEPVLVLYDGTVLGSAENGFVVTPERLCWKNFLEHPRQIAWSEIDPARVVPDLGRVSIAGGSIAVSSDLVGQTARFLTEMAGRCQAEPGGPYRRTAGAAAESAEGRHQAVARLARTARRQLGEVDDLYFYPAIPPQKLRKARATHAAHLASGELCAVLYDDTVFGGAEEGFLLTTHRLCWKNLSSGSEAVAFGDLDPQSVSARRNVVRLMGSAIHFTAQSELAGPVAALLTALVREARGGPSP
jgi:hypothetical protein